MNANQVTTEFYTDNELSWRIGVFSNNMAEIKKISISPKNKMFQEEYYYLSSQIFLKQSIN